MNEMIERVGKAIYLAAGGARDAFPSLIHFDLAEAAIQAMRDPTPQMLDAAAKAMSPKHRPTQDRVSVKQKHKIRYQAMIDAATEEDDG